MKTYLFYILTAACLFISCDKTDDPVDPTAENGTGDTLIFGHYFGECLGESCVEIFRLTATDLAEDRKDTYAGAGDFDFETLSQDKFELVKNLISEIPEELIAEEDQTFGCPDCGDWGGNYISWISSGETQTWNIDMVQESIPDYLHDFMDSVNEKIQLLRE